MKKFQTNLLKLHAWLRVASAIDQERFCGLTGSKTPLLLTREHMRKNLKRTIDGILYLEVNLYPSIVDLQNLISELKLE